MKLKKWLSLAICGCLALSLAACGGDETAVYVQPVSALSGSGTIAPGDRFPGMVVSENVTEIQKDSDKSVAELLVKAGDDVTEGQQLFSYDTDELQLNLDKKKLELQQLQTMIDSYTDQIKDLEKRRDKASSSDQLQYTVEIQSLQVDLKEAELNIQAKQTEITQSEAILENAVVYSPISGRIQSINESGTDNYGNPVAYITIQQAGSFRVQATLGELQRGGILEGTRMKIVSRTDESQFWMGTVTLVDYENPSQGSGSGIISFGVMESDPMSSSSKYPFYVELDSTEGLILGQHVYLELDTSGSEATGLQLSSYFVCYNEDGSSYVWADKKGRLEKRSVTLGEYDSMMDTYQILEGLSDSDYIAFPDDELCHEGAPTTREEPVPEDTQQPDTPYIPMGEESGVR